MAIPEFPDDMFNFAYYCLGRHDHGYGMVRKPLCIYAFKGKDNYAFSYMKDAFHYEELSFIYMMLMNARKKDDFVRVAEELIKQISERL